MDSPIRVKSEVGKLKRVLLHRPGQELENLMPQYLSRQLFEDIPYLVHAREEHDQFAATLRESGCLLYTSPSPRDRTRSRMPSSA
jgi:arginine deiminase